MSELDNKKALVSDDYNTLMKPSKSEDGASGKSTTTGHRRELEQSLASGKIVVELLDEEVDEFVPISSQFPDGQSFAVVSRSKREHGLKEQFAKWKKKLNKILQNTRHFEFSSCGDRSNVWKGKHLTLDSFCEVRVSLYISSSNTSVGDVEIHSCLERGDQFKYAEFYHFLHGKFSNEDVGAPVHPNIFPPTMTNTVAVDDELCKEYAFSLLRMARNSKHPNPRISALRSIGRLQLSSNHVLDDEEVCREVIFTIDEAWKNQMITALEKEMLVVVTQKLLQSIEELFVTSSGSFIHLVQWVLQFASVAENERYQFVQSARVAADILRKLSQRRGNQLMASLISHGFEHDRTQYYQLVDRIDLDSYIVKAIVEFRNSFS